MTDKTDRSAEILASLDKLAENGMPFIDVVKRDGFGGFPSKGAQPLPTEPVQIHEDPGAAYWKEATKMTDQTDRIKQMAEHADMYADALDGSGELQRTGRTWAEVRAQYFAALVAEDCARVADELRGFDWESAASADRISQAIRARYGLKGE